MPSLAAFYGKIPSQPDFVRINAGAFQQAGWDAWFQAGMADLQRLGLPPPSTPLCFVFASGRGRVCAGALAPGRDALARSFPAILSLETPAPALGSLAAWRQQQATFFAEARRLALQACQLTTSELAARLLALGMPERGCPAQPEALAEASLSELTERGDLAGLAYAITTAIAACAEARAARPAMRPLTLYGQASTDVQRAFWIELVERHLDQAPSLSWTDQTFAITLGHPHPAVLACLVDPDRPGPCSWPLRTPHQSARAAAIAKLSPAQAHVLGMPGASLPHVLSVFSRKAH
jgi:type VI secretion system ImpM family protein